MVNGLALELSARLRWEEEGLVGLGRRALIPDRRDRDPLDLELPDLGLIEVEDVEHGGRMQVVTNGMNRLRGYDLLTGDLIWEGPGTTMNPIPSPVAADGMAFVTSGFRGNSLRAIRLAEARGDLTSSNAIAWTLDRDTPYVPSPLLYGGVLYFLKDRVGILSALDARTGKPHYQAQRIDAMPGQVFASPVGAAGRVYVLGQEGTMVVLKHGPALEVLATNKLEDKFDASPALVDREIYLRGYRYLYCVAE